MANEIAAMTAAYHLNCVQLHAILVEPEQDCLVLDLTDGGMAIDLLEILRPGLGLLLRLFTI